MFKGIDISEFQQNVHYDKLDVDFVMIRTGYGRHAKQRDKMVAQHVKGCADNHIPYGFYHYSYADTPAKAVEEAKFCLSIISDTGATPEYPIAFDFEDISLSKLTPSQSAAVVDAFCATILGAGYMPIVYASLSWLTKKLTGMSDWDVWVAQWANKCSYEDKTMWQYTSNGTIAGIKGRVDMNVSYVDYPARVRNEGFNGFKAHSDNVSTGHTEAPEQTPSVTPGSVIEESHVTVGDVTIDSLIIDNIMYVPLRDFMRIIGSAQMHVIWHDDKFSAEVVLGNREDAE